MKAIFLFLSDVSLTFLISSLNVRAGKLFTCLMIGLFPWIMVAQSAPDPDPLEAFPISCLTSVTDATTLPILEVQVNVHFIGAIGDNFVPGTPEQNGQALIGTSWNGNYAAIEMVNRANLIMSNLTSNPIGLADFLGDSRIRFKLYTEESNANDLHDGIWYWETTPSVSTLPYGDKVLHLLVKDRNTSWSGMACALAAFCNTIELSDWYDLIITNGTDFSGNSYGTAILMAKTLIHEVGHLTGLCHSFNSGNQCNDIDVAAECFTGSSGGDCGNSSGSCANYDSGSHNIMGHNKYATALSPCQWSIYYSRLLVGAPQTGERAKYVKNLGCESGVMPPITIQSGTDIYWETQRVIGGPVIIKSNATLTISCAHFFTSGAYINVERGGKLKIINGAIFAACGEPSWKGIFVEGNANEPQPDPEADVSETDDWKSGVVYLDGAYISGAYTAVNTWKEGQLGNPDYWGGVVYAKGSTFENNRRGVAFMAYDKENKSAFLESCRFREIGGMISGTVGVTIWGCYGIDFVGNIFDDLDIAGIYGIDFGLSNVKSNQFTNCNRGIEIYSSAPLTNFKHTIGWLPNDKNYFRNGKAGIYAESTDELRGLDVFNNSFSDGDHSIYLSGRARFKVKHNVLSQNYIRAFYAYQTGESLNFFDCNTIFDPTFLSVHLHGNNRGLQLRYNTFQDVGTWNIQLNNLGNLYPGTIAEFQGDFGNPADNCFTLPTKAIFTNSSVPFTYFVREDYQQAECSTLLPVNSTSLNYSVQFTTNNSSLDCNDEDIPGIPPYDKPDLVQARNVVTQAEANSQARPGNLNYYAAYLQARDTKDKILQSLLIEALDAQNYTEAGTLLTEEGTPIAQQWLLSVKLIAKDFTGAQQVWNALPSATQDEQWFRDIMQVNLQRLQNMGTYALSSSQETTLYTIADSDSPYRSYARALLALFKGERFPLDESEAPLSEAPQTQQMALTQGTAPVFSVAPNPASDAVAIRYPVSERLGLPKQLWLVQLSTGVSVKQINLDDSGLYSLHTRDLISGVYLLRIRDKTGILYQTKLVILP